MANPTESYTNTVNALTIVAGDLKKRQNPQQEAGVSAPQTAEGDIIKQLDIAISNLNSLRLYYAHEQANRELPTMSHKLTEGRREEKEHPSPYQPTTEGLAGLIEYFRYLLDVYSKDPQAIQDNVNLLNQDYERFMSELKTGNPQLRDELHESFAWLLTDMANAGTTSRVIGPINNDNVEELFTNLDAKQKFGADWQQHMQALKARLLVRIQHDLKELRARIIEMSSSNDNYTFVADDYYTALQQYNKLGPAPSFYALRSLLGDILFSLMSAFNSMHLADEYAKVAAAHTHPR